MKPPSLSAIRYVTEHRTVTKVVLKRKNDKRARSKVCDRTVTKVVLKRGGRRALFESFGHRTVTKVVLKR